MTDYPALTLETPAEHPFAQFVRILGKGKRGARDLTRAEAREAMGMVLDDKVEDTQLGAFLMLLRHKEESAEAMAGFTEALRERWNPPALAGGLDGPTYAGKQRHPPEGRGGYRRPRGEDWRLFPRAAGEGPGARGGLARGPPPSRGQGVPAGLVRRGSKVRPGRGLVAHVRRGACAAKTCARKARRGSRAARKTRRRAGRDQAGERSKTSGRRQCAGEVCSRRRTSSLSRRSPPVSRQRNSTPRPSSPGDWRAHATRPSMERGAAAPGGTTSITTEVPAGWNCRGS